MPVQPVFIPQKKGKKPSDTVETVEIPKGDQASESFKRSVVKEMVKSGLAVRRYVIIFLWLYSVTKNTDNQNGLKNT